MLIAPIRLRGVSVGSNAYRNYIQRKGKRNQPLSACQAARNRRIARSRVRIEHVFAVIGQMGGKLIRTVCQARANFAMTMMAACYNLKRLAYLQKSGIAAF
jgi:IS5 family transposase